MSVPDEIALIRSVFFLKYDILVETITNNYNK